LPIGVDAKEVPVPANLLGFVFS
jgi:hypothetical protein